jgi:hypothetical protein
MADYYIRTPDREESRGPFDASKLLTLAEAGQINENTLYYDEKKEEWTPIALNKVLTAEVFPQRKKLTLKVGQPRAKKVFAETDAPSEVEEEEQEEEEEGLNVEAMLAAAEADTEETRYLKQQDQSFEKAAGLSSPGIGLMMLLSAVFFLMPHFSEVTKAFSNGSYSSLINYPFILVALIDFVMAACLFLAVTEIYPLLRGRGMLTFGFGLYLGWSIGDPLIMAAAATGGFGIFYATLAQNYPMMILTILLGVGGNGTLAYLAFVGRFSEFFGGVHLNIMPPG